MIFLAITTSLGGGVIRDVLLNKLPPAMFVNYGYVITAILTAVATFSAVYFQKNTALIDNQSLNRIMNLFDALGLGVFTISGVNTVVSSAGQQSFLFAVFIGMTTGIGGGMLRDVMLTEIPFVLRKHIYAVASLAGASVYYLLFQMGLNTIFSMFLGIAIILAIRILATIFRWKLPKAL